MDTCIDNIPSFTSSSKDTSKELETDLEWKTFLGDQSCLSFKVKLIK